MTQRIGNVVIIEDEEDQKCEICGKIAECRPYGPNGKQICFECAQKPEYNTIVKKNFKDRLTGKTDENS